MRKAENRCLTASLDGSSAEVISLVSRCEKVRKQPDVWAEKGAEGWMHGGL